MSASGRLLPDALQRRWAAQLASTERAKRAQKRRFPDELLDVSIPLESGQIGCIQHRGGVVAESESSP